MIKLLYFVSTLIWIIDILNLNILINDINIRILLDETIPINTAFWILFWIFMPSSSSDTK